MGAAYHSNFFVWFEVGRSEYFRRVVQGNPGAFFEHHGMPVIEASACYHAPCRYDDLIVIRTQVAALRSRTILFKYEIRSRDGNDALLAEGQTLHVCVDADGNVCRIPDSVRGPIVEAETGNGPTFGDVQ